MESTKQSLTFRETKHLMDYRRMPIEVESPEQIGYGMIRNNLAESSYTDTPLRDFQTGNDLGDLLLCYGSHKGHEGLRELIAHEGPAQVREHRLRGREVASLDKDDVLLTMGAAGALFIVATALLEKGDEMVVVHPNYATNIETPRAIGAAVRTIDLRFEEGFALDIDRVKTALSIKTKYVSVTHPHNPTGVCLAENQLRELALLAESTGVRILVDETYRDMVFGQRLPPAAAFSPLLISISSVSKTYGLPGLRTGWIICRDRRLLETFMAAKEQMHICGPVLDEELAYRYLLHRDRYLPRILADIAAKFSVVKTWMEHQDELEWVEPQGGCVCFPRLRHPQRTDIDKFYSLLLDKFGTYVGPGHWFGMPRHYMRLGFGWPTLSQLEEGLSALGEAFRETAL
jgi:aspartate/methionine/tyrosine aminotransferase